MKGEVVWELPEVQGDEDSETKSTLDWTLDLARAELEKSESGNMNVYWLIVL